MCNLLNVLSSQVAKLVEDGFSLPSDKLKEDVFSLPADKLLEDGFSLPADKLFEDGFSLQVGKIVEMKLTARRPVTKIATQEINCILISLMSPKTLDVVAFKFCDF